MSFKSQLGFTIPNADLKFSCKKTKIFEDYLFVITNSNEILTFKKEEDQINKVSYYEKKYLILTNMQEREEILNMFIMDSSNQILTNQNTQKTLIIISSNFIIYYFNLEDGLCVNKINISLISNDQILLITSILKRFILFIFKRKAMLYDSFSHIVFKEEQMKFLNRTEDEEKNEFHSFEVKNVYQIKENCFFLRSSNEETFFLCAEKLNSIEPLGLNYEDTRIRIVKQMFELNKFFNEDTKSCIFSNDEFLFYNMNNIIKVCFLDSIEELTEISSYLTQSKFPIIYVNKLFIKKEENLIVIYKDLSCELFTYDKKLREIKTKQKLMLMVEDEFLDMNYLTTNNVLIGYTEDTIQVFDFRRVNNNNEKYVDKTIDLKEIFNQEDKKIYFTNYLNVNFPSYVKDILNQLSPQIEKNSDPAKENEKNDENKMENKDNNISPEKKENSDIDMINSNILPQKIKYNFEITSSLIYSYSENKSIYYIIGTDTGKVAIIDIFFSDSLKLNPVIFLDYHTSPIETFSIYENRILITSSLDGMVSFTDISNQKIEAAIYTATRADIIDNDNMDNIMKKNQSYHRKNSLDENITNQFNFSYINKLRKNSINKLSEKINLLTLIPSYNIKSFSKLIRVLPVVLLDHDFSYYIPDEQKRKNKSLISLIFENNEAIVVRMDNFASIYRFNQASTNLKIQAVYHISYQKTLIFYLSNNSIKVSSYASRTCDRYISDLNKIYDMLRVEEKLSLYFEKSDKVKNLVSYNTEDDLKYDSDVKRKKSDPYEKYKINVENKKDENHISVSFIKKSISDPQEKKLFAKKLFEIAMSKRQKLFISSSQFEATFMRSIEMHIIDKIIGIINKNENEILQKIKIMNVLNNPQLFNILQDKYKSSEDGICNNYMYYGEQYCQNFTLNYEDYFNYIENKVRQQQNISNSVFRNNYYNFISLFHIWNFNIDLDYTLNTMYKLFQPILDFYPILIGVDSTCSIILKEERKNVYLNTKFNEHFNFFKEYIITKTKEKKNSNKTNQQKSLFLDKNMLIENQQGYLVNLKNYQISTNLSHHMHIGLFGSLIALLGYVDNKRLCDFIDIEKKIMKTLTIKTQIKYSNLNMFHNFMYEDNDDLTSTNKDLLLYDYLQFQFHISTKDRYDINAKMEFKVIMNNIMLYLNQIYKYIFNMKFDDERIYSNFSKLTKDSNLDFGNKLDFLSEFELSLITFLILYNHVALSSNSNTHDQLPDNIIKKITHLLVITVFKIINEKNLKISFCRNVADLLGKTKDILENIYSDNINNYALFLIQYYTTSNVPINLDSPFKKFEMGNYSVLKSEENPLFLKLILAKLLLQFSKNKLSSLIKVIKDEFQNKKNEDYIYCSYLIEILFILFREKSYRLVTFLPTVITIIMKTMNPKNKEIKNTCKENSKRVLSKLLMNYPMVAYHHDSYKLAIGSNDGKIYIYDVGTGELWKNVTAHKNEISALIFDHTGNIIVSYCSNEGLVKCFKIGLTNFFSNLLSNKEYKQYKYNVIRVNNKDDIIENVSFEIVRGKEHELILRRENGSIQIIKI